ncbi:MAG: MFS transporter, partial [Pseudomonadota bacterium]
MTPSAEALDRNVRLCPWFRACSDLMFWQAVWFLSFQSRLSASEAILLYAVYEASTTALEAPSGWMSDRLGRRATLIAGAAAAAAGAFLLAGAGGFAAAWAGMALLGAGAAFASGADSAFLYESLAARGRRDETERWELRVWRFGFAALAVSAVLGAALARAAPAAPFAATGAAFCAALVIAWRFVEPPRTDGGAGAARIGETLALLRRPALAWLFALGLLS